MKWTIHYHQWVSTVLAYLHVQVSPISCWVVGSILALLGKITETAIVGERWTGVGRHHALYCSLVQKVPPGVPDYFSAIPMSFQNFVATNKIHYLKKIHIYILYMRKDNLSSLHTVRRMESNGLHIQRFARFFMIRFRKKMNWKQIFDADHANPRSSQNNSNLSGALHSFD